MMTSGEQSQTNWAAIVLGTLGALLGAAGALRFVLAGHFSLREAGGCLLSVPAGMLLLVIFDYTWHHARVACLMILLLLAMLAVRSPSFCVGLGVALLVILAMQL